MPQVPREPTEAMVEAGDDAYIASRNFKTMAAALTLIWRAMCDAAPAAPTAHTASTPGHFASRPSQEGGAGSDAAPTAAPAVVNAYVIETDEEWQRKFDNAVRAADLAPARVLINRRFGALQSRVAELERENESLRAQCGLRQIQGYREGMEEAAKICDTAQNSGLIYMPMECARRIRAKGNTDDAALKGE